MLAEKGGRKWQASIWWTGRNRGGLPGQPERKYALHGTCTVAPISLILLPTRISTHLPSLTELHLLGKGFPAALKLSEISYCARTALGLKTITHTSRKTTQCSTINKWVKKNKNNRKKRKKKQKAAAPTQLALCTAARQ